MLRYGVYLIRIHMSLAERLSKATGNGAGLPCKIGSLIAGDQLSKEDKAQLIKTLEVPYGTPGRWPNTQIASALRDEGYDVGTPAITKHRRGDCRCFGNNPKVKP